MPDTLRHHPDTVQTPPDTIWPPPDTIHTTPGMGVFTHKRELEEKAISEYHGQI